MAKACPKSDAAARCHPADLLGRKLSRSYFSHCFFVIAGFRLSTSEIQSAKNGSINR
jgi:hypothetical protein